MSNVIGGGDTGAIDAHPDDARINQTTTGSLSIRRTVTSPQLAFNNLFFRRMCLWWRQGQPFSPAVAIEQSIALALLRPTCVLRLLPPRVLLRRIADGAPTHLHGLRMNWHVGADARLDNCRGPAADCINKMITAQRISCSPVQLLRSAYRGRLSVAGVLWF